jgi:hypothetical protein
MICRWHLLSLLATTLAASLVSSEGQQESDLFFALSEDEEMSQSTTPQRAKSPYPSQSAQGDMFASAALPLNSSWGGWEVELSGEWLYWKAREEGMEYAAQGFIANRSPGEQKIRERLHGFNPDYQSGYRIELDVILPYDQWDVRCTWTRYNQTAHSKVPQKEGKVVWPLFLDSVTVIYQADSASARWNLNFNTFDLELGRSFFVGKHLSLRPFVGFEGAWIEQKLHIAAVNFESLPRPFSTPLLSENNYNNFQGYGLRTGIDSKWPLFYGMSLFANLSYSILSSVFHVSQFQKNADSPRGHIKDRISFASQNFQMSGGITWEYLFCNERFSLDIHAGWEQQVWLDQNQLNILYGGNFGPSVGRTFNQQGNLTLSGWLIGARFGF